MVVATVGWSATGAAPLEYEKRISAQSAIEEVYWRHRIWPSDNPGAKPSLSQVLPEDALRGKVEDYLLKSKALESLWTRRIRDEELQAEIERMAASSRAPQVLQEIFAALENDPILVAECLARPLVVDRLIRKAYAYDRRYHLPLRTAIRQSLARHASVADAGRLDGKYSEADWVLGGKPPERARPLAGGRVIRMDRTSWRGRLARLQAGFPPSGATPAQSDPRVEDLPVGIFGEIREDEDTFFVQAVLEKGSDRLRVATVVWQKEPFDAWWARARETLRPVEPIPVGSSRGAAALPALPSTACTPDTWRETQTAGAPSPRDAHTAVWTGSEMIVWGGYNGATDLATGGRYDPATNSWTGLPTSGAPEARDTHIAVWTGQRMVVWGGGNEAFVPKDTGGRYDPATNTWATVATSGAPSARLYHTAIWSGSRMVVWGGWDGNGDVDTGGRYDPVGNSWATTTRTGAPSARDGHTAVWSGTRMVVWGGEDDNAIAQNTGGRYDPVGNAWLTTEPTTAPVARWLHTAVWTGSKMIVWGGYDGSLDLNSGGIYDPAANSWIATSTVGAPPARDQHIAVWTAGGPSLEMDVWGGQDDAVVQLNSGGRYNPDTNAWTAMSTLLAPTGRRFHTGIWNGTEMIPWGGWNEADLASGGLYCSGACAGGPPAGSSTLSMSKQVGGELVSWTSVPAAVAFDLVRGTLNQLRGSGGDFATSTQACLANDGAATSFLDPAPAPVGNGYWYLVRGLSCAGAGTYNVAAGSQIGSRDAEIGASPNRCP